VTTARSTAMEARETSTKRCSCRRCGNGLCAHSVNLHVTIIVGRLLTHALLQLGPSASRPVSAYRDQHTPELFNGTPSPSRTPVMGGDRTGRQRPLTPMTMGLVKHILKTSEGAFGLSDDAAAGMSVHSLVQKKTQLLHEEEAMLAQFMTKETASAAERTLQLLAKTRVKDISRQLRVLSTWSSKHSAQQLTVPDELSFSRPSSAYRSVLSHVSAPHQTDTPDVLRLGTPGVFNNFSGGFGAMALESNVQVQQSWPAVASVVMTPWGAALSPLPPLGVSADSPQQVQSAGGRDQNARNKDSEIILLQQKHIERQQRLLDDLIS
jgi:hypothetical protein